MAEEPKKISFGFSRINKKPVISLPKKEEKEIQFIDCLEGNSIKLVNGVEKEKELPVIPLRNGNILRDNMIEALKARKEKKSVDIETINDVKNHKSEDECKPLTLDELAAKEILEDLKKVKENDEIQEIRTIPKAGGIEVSEKESSLDDYESMPVNQFGLAVLRGMGWAPDKGIGKNSQIVKPVNPVLRPKGMGLGADKVIPPPKTVSNEELFMKKGAFLKILSGMHKGLYGVVEGFDELPGRIIIRLTLQNTTLSISENIVELVTVSEYNKNSKILNLKEYNTFLDNKKHTNSERSAENILREKDAKVPDKSKYEKEEKKLVQKSKCKSHNHTSKKKNHSQNYTSSSDSDTEKETRYRSDKHKSSDRYHKSSKYVSKRRVYKDSSDSDSSTDKRKSKSKKHKHKSSYRSRSRSRSVSRKKKKKRSQCRSRS